MGELPNVLKGIMNEHVFPREKFIRHGMNHQFRCKTCHLVSSEAEFKGQRLEVKKQKHVKKKNGSLLFYTISLSGSHYQNVVEGSSNRQLPPHERQK